jgi:hypothetical protein
MVRNRSLTNNMETVISVVFKFKNILCGFVDTNKYRLTNKLLKTDWIMTQEQIEDYMIEE